MSKYEALLSLAEFILPASFLEYFDVIDVKSEKESLHIYLDEQKVLPDDCSRAVSKGFMDEVLIRDFPIRDRKVTLHVRRRRWFDPETNKSRIIPKSCGICISCINFSQSINKEICISYSS